MYRLINTPFSSLYLGAEKYYPDYYGLLGFLRRGMRMSWVDILLSGFAHSEYSILGKIDSYLNIPIHFYYQVIRVGLVALPLYFLYLFYRKTLRKKWLAGFLIAVFGAGLPIFDKGKGLVFKTDFDFYQFPSPLYRFYREPHHLIGIGLSILIFVFFAKVFKRATIKRVFVLGGLAIICGFFHATSVIIFNIGLSFFLFFGVLFYKKKFINVKKRICEISFLFFSFLPLFYYKFLWLIHAKSEGNIYAQMSEKSYSLLDSRHPLKPLVIGFFLSLGLPFVLSIFGFFKRLKKFKKIDLLVFCYFLAISFFYFLGFKILGVSRIRVHQVVFYLPLGYFGAKGLYFLKEKIVKVGYILVLFGLFFSSLIFYVNDFKKEFNQFKGDLAVYPKKDWFEGIEFLNKDKDYVMVLSMPRASYFLPGFADKKWYISDVGHTIDYNKRLDKVSSFFKGSMNESKARNFLKGIEAEYVFYGDEERSLGGDLGRYGFLAPVFKNKEVVIFKVEND